MISSELIAYRKTFNLTQADLGKLLGVTKVCISRWESGERKIPAFLHLALDCLKVKKGGGLKKRETKKKGGKEHGKRNL